jgi:hypothetical protein
MHHQKPVTELSIHPTKFLIFFSSVAHVLATPTRLVLADVDAFVYSADATAASAEIRISFE